MVRGLVGVIAAGCGPKVPASTAPASAPAPAAPAAVVAAWRVADATVEPELLRGLLTDYYDVRTLLSASVAGGSVSVLVAAGLPDDTQDLCTPTATVSAPLGDGASFAVSDVSIGFAVKDVAGTLDGATVRGHVAGDAVAIDEVRGIVDTRSFLTLLGADADDALCAMMPGMGTCGPCPDGAARCWTIGFTGPTLRALPGATVVPRSRAEVCADPACAGRPGCN